MNISIQEILVFVVLALLVAAVVWWLIRIVKAASDGYRSAGQPVSQNESPAEAGQ